MKTRLIFLMLVVSNLIACRKDVKEIPARTISTSPSPNQNLSLGEVKDWVSKQLSPDTGIHSQSTLHTFSFRKLELNFDKAEMVSTQKRFNWWVMALPGQPTFQNVKQGYRKLAIMRDSSGKIKANVLEIIPDALYVQRKQRASTSDFTGRVFIYNQGYEFLGGKVYKDGRQIGVIKPGKSTANANSSKLTTNMMDVIADCAWYDSSYIDAEGVFTIHSEQVCSYSVYDDGFYPDMDGGGGGSSAGGDGLGSGGGGGGDASSTPEIADLPQQTNPKIDTKSYMACFSSLPDIGAKMTVTIYVQEPAPGLPFNIGANSVGHTAIGLTKTYNGQTITQVIGFYPDATGKDKMHAPSKVADNTDLNYTVSVSYPIIASEFSKVISFIANPPGTYDLASYNCTNFANDAAAAGGITLPNPTGNIGLMQTGMTPGALGSSIRDAAPVLNANTNGGVVDKTHGPCN